jgi:hypothetical protein
MTAISAVKSSNSVHIFSDAAWHDPTSGKFCGIGTKVHSFPEHNAVFAVTGMSTVPQLLSALLMENQFADYRSLCDAMWDLIKTCSTRGKAVGLSMTGRCDVVLAGWCDDVGSSIFVTQCFFDHDIFKGAAAERYVRPSIDDSSLMQFSGDGLALGAMSGERRSRVRRRTALARALPLTAEGAAAPLRARDRHRVAGDEDPGAGLLRNALEPGRPRSRRTRPKRNRAPLRKVGIPPD